MATLALIGIILFCLYCIVTTTVFFIPVSLSESYYLWSEKGSEYKGFFGAALVLTAVLLIAPMLELGIGSIWQFTGFLTPAGLLFTAATPHFKNKNLTDKWLHPASAWICAISAIIWQLCIAEMWQFMIIALVFNLFLALVTRTLKKCYTFWIEMVCFLSIFCCLIKIYYF